MFSIYKSDTGGVLWPHPARVTRLNHPWGANEAEISFQISALAGV